MNGDMEKVYKAIGQVKDRLAIIETKQEERHNVNQDDMKIVKAFAHTIDKQCQAITRLQTHKTMQWFFIGGIIISIMGVAIRTWYAHI